MASNHGLFGGSLTFDHHIQEWKIFLSRFTQYCVANDVNADTDKSGVKRRALLLSALVEDTYRVVRDLLHPRALETLEYAVLLEELNKHFVTKKSSFAERYKFYKAEQRPGEDLAEWAARVRSLALYCEFKSDLETALRDRFVLGLENVKEKEKLFSESIDTLTFARALELAQDVRCARLALQGSRAEAKAAVQEQSVFAMRTGPTGPTAGKDRRVPAKQCCSVCGYNSHDKEQCRFVNFTCKKCFKKGHLKRMCTLNVKSNNFLAAEDDFLHYEGNYDFFNIKCVNGKPMRQIVSIAREQVLCEVDSGSAVSVVPADEYELKFKHICQVKPCKVILNCYNGTKISPLGCVTLPVTFEGRTNSITFYIIKTAHKQPTLLGRDFISAFNMQLCVMSCNNLQADSLAEELKSEYAQLFADELGQFNKYKVTLKIKPDVPLKFFKPRTVPLALRDKVDSELDRLVSLGILERVEHSEVATPIVPVLRRDGGVRICGDYSVTLNKALYVDSYPLPRIEDLFARLHGGIEFSKLDLSRAYNQLVLDDSKKLTCINTHKGMFCYNRLVFGLASAPSVFQRTIEQLLAGIDGVCIFLDDILVTGPTRAEHLERLKNVLSRLQDAGLRLKEEKCELFKDSVEYLGFIIDKNGLRKTNSKVEAILKSNPPQNEKELKSFLGMINYYRCFIPNVSSVLAPLHSLLRKGEKWCWGKEQDDAFEEIKKELASERVLAHFDPALPTVVTADAGPRGLGALLAQRQPDGTERVVAYASRSLTKPELNYAQIQKEATAIVFAIKKFHHYVYGCATPFTLRTDHRPLLSILGSKKGVPEMAANRLQRYALFLSAYNFDIEYVKSENNVADFLSRAVSCKTHSELESSEEQILFINYVTDSVIKPLTLSDIKQETDREETLRKVAQYIKNGWPSKVSDSVIKPFFLNRHELSLENGCVLRGHRLVIPSIFREQILNELHETHFGVVKTKSDARARIWWPNIDKHIEEKIGSCTVCNMFRYAPGRSPLAPWTYPARPWERLHLDMFTLANKQFLIIVDAFSKWPECFIMADTDSGSIIDKLDEVFSRHGLARTLVTDNASNFCSTIFENFCSNNGIKHLTSAPYHPASNGQAENSVKTVKRGLKLILAENVSQRSISQKLNKFLFSYRNSIHCTTGFSPAQLLLGRRLRCRLDLLHVNKDDSSSDANATSSAAKYNVIKKQISQSDRFGGKRKVDFKIGQKVLVKHFFDNGSKHIWKVGFIKEIVGSMMYWVYIPDLNLKTKKHKDYVLPYKGTDRVVSEDDDDLSCYGEITRNSNILPVSSDLQDVTETPLTSQSPTSRVLEQNQQIQEEDPDDSFCSVPELLSPQTCNNDLEDHTTDAGAEINGEEDNRDAVVNPGPSPLTGSPLAPLGDGSPVAPASPGSAAQQPSMESPTTHGESTTDPGLEQNRAVRSTRNKHTRYKNFF